MSKVWIDETEPAPPDYIWCQTYEDAVSTLLIKQLFDSGICALNLGGDELSQKVVDLVIANHFTIDYFTVHGGSPLYGAERLISAGYQNKDGRQRQIIKSVN